MRFEDVRRVAMVGAGTMGAGMAMCFAQAGYDVTMYSRTPEGLDRALNRIRNSQNVIVQEGLISALEAARSRQRIAATTQLEEGLEGAHYVLESVPEDLALKQKLFRQMEALCTDDTILATNTSGLSITAIAADCQHPERVGGMHWANPAEIVPLVEVIRGEKTSDNTVDVIYRIAEKLGKVPVRVQKDILGFASNRLQAIGYRKLAEEVLQAYLQGEHNLWDESRSCTLTEGNFDFFLDKYKLRGRMDRVDDFAPAGSEIIGTYQFRVYRAPYPRLRREGAADDRQELGRLPGSRCIRHATAVWRGCGKGIHPPVAREPSLPGEEP